MTVTNTGKRQGATVVQMYLNDPVASISRPVEELKGFRRIDLNAGESQKVTFRVNEDDLKFLDPQMKYVAEPGVFNLMIGLDSVRTQKTQFTYQ